MIRNKPTVEPPKGWILHGSLPDFDPAGAEISPDQLLSLTEDLWWATSPDGRFEIDVGWYPQSDAKGHFGCKIIDSENWTHPVEDLCVRSVADASTWISRAFAWCEGYGVCLPTDRQSKAEVATATQYRRKSSAASRRRPILQGSMIRFAPSGESHLPNVRLSA